MPIVRRVSLPTYNALTDNDPRHFSIFSDEDNVLIKEQSRGAVIVDTSQTVEVTHSLGYSPHCYVYADLPTGKKQIVNGYNLFGDWRMWVDSTKLYVQNVSGTNDLEASYFIFYDNID